MDNESDSSSDSECGQSTSNKHEETHQNDSSSDSDNCKTDKAKNKDDGSSPRLVRKETSQVLVLRVIVIIVLLCAASAVSVLVHKIMVKSEQTAFEAAFESAASKVKETFIDVAAEKMGAVGSLVVSFVAESQSSNARPWPFVTMQSFQERAATAMRLSGALFIGKAHLVNDEQRKAWENFTRNDPDRSWYQESHEYQKGMGLDDMDKRPQIQTDDPNLKLSAGIANYIYNLKREVGAKAVVAPKAPYYLPIWQTAPVTNWAVVNQNRLSNSKAAASCVQNGTVVFEGMKYSPAGYSDNQDPFTSEVAWLLTVSNKRNMKYDGDIYTTAYLPIFSSFHANRTVVGTMRIVILWARYFRDVLTTGITGVVVVLDNSCDEAYTYQINGPDVIPLGNGDLHDHAYDHYGRSASFQTVDNIPDGTKGGLKLLQGDCPYSIRVYPSSAFVSSFQTDTPAIVTTSVVCVFAFAVLMFFAYDYLVERRQNLILRKAQQTHKIVASLFPENVRNRLLQDDVETKKNAGGFRQVDNFINNSDNSSINNQAPIADLFPSATVMFADIAGFTAWSSSREPAQVFILLQNLYQEFDTIATRRKVFKVETIGDSYVAVGGLPEPLPKHALTMVRFASECMYKANEVFQSLETALGPGTGELMIRFGLHSGPVTAGVLRGDRARFQLFGDTVNTASRMDSTGLPGKIQATQATVDELIKVGKEHWVRPRQDNVMAKGKGMMQTFWIRPHVKASTKSSTTSSESGSTLSTSNHGALQPEGLDTIMKKERLIDWMVELLTEHIKNIVARRRGQSKNEHTVPLAIANRKPGQNSLEEVVEVIDLPAYDAMNTSGHHVELNDRMVSSLRELVSTLASTYRDNPFHNFDHACHVTMNVNKFLKRIQSAELELQTTEKSLPSNHHNKNNIKDMNQTKKCYTHGITSDPITVFAIVLSALIHDVDHRGISNTQLMIEDPNLAQYFGHKSIAEQNSLDIAWTIFSEDRFVDLRQYIFGSQQELDRFRQVLVNIVLATDIFDPDLSTMRKARWEKAFSDSDGVEVDASSPDSNSSNHLEEINKLRATIVMEHIIQASDVCHTMQHWHIYRKWNMRLFQELMIAYNTGRLSSDPSTFWYMGELNFFDKYVIPLAKKLKDCKVFGVSSDEALNYALLNRAEWEIRGKDIVEEMQQEFASTTTSAAVEKKT